MTMSGEPLPDLPPADAVPDPDLDVHAADQLDDLSVSPSTGSIADDSPVPPWTDLPEVVRGRIVDWAARTLGSLPPAQIPPALSRVARFTPAKRARLGARVLSQMVADDAGFRAAVAEYARREAEAARDLASAAAGVVDEVTAAAGAYLLRLPDNAELLAKAGETGQVDRLRSRVAELERTLMRFRSRVDTLSAERDHARHELAAAAPEAERELEKLRTRLREQGTRVRAAELATQAGRGESTHRIAELEAALARTERSAAEWQARTNQAVERADRAERSLSAHRDSAGLERAAADRKLDLLLSTVEGAAGGLRRQLELTGGGLDPADVVAGGLPTVAPARTRAADPARLNDWLMLPAAHLVVDGYNVTKTGYPDLSLADQRDRLIRSLASLSARTSAEITVVFDGAAVTTSQPSGRGIRVLFSPPGVIADDVIRQLVAEEPPGRVLVVASSDREVVAGVVRNGARTAPSAVLLDLLGR